MSYMLLRPARSDWLRPVVSISGVLQNRSFPCNCSLTFIQATQRSRLKKKRKKKNLRVMVRVKHRLPSFCYRMIKCEHRRGLSWSGGWFISLLTHCAGVLPGGAGVRPAEGRRVQQGHPHLPPLEDQRQEVWADVPEPRRRPCLRPRHTPGHRGHQPRLGGLCLHLFFFFFTSPTHSEPT